MPGMMADKTDLHDQTPAIYDRLDAIIAMSDADLAQRRQALAGELLQIGEAALEAYVSARGLKPTKDKKEGFRLLALHRQGAKGEPAFNACRESCREIVYLHNCIQMKEYIKDAPRRIKLAAMVARHIVLFIDGKLLESGLGEFCCSSRPLRQNEIREIN